jgi:hypothetical protein
VRLAAALDWWENKFVKKGMRVAVLVALVIAAQTMMAQRGGHMGGGGMRMGGGAHVGGAGFRAAGPTGPRFIGTSPRSSAFVHPGFRGGGVRFRGAAGFGHNPRFFVGFGSGFGNCFGGFCRGGFGRRGFFGGGIPWIVPYAYYPYSYYGYGAYPYADYGVSDQQYVDSYQYSAGQAANSYAEGYQQGATQQQVQELSNQVARLQAELDERRNAAPSPQPRVAVQELPLNATLVMRNGKRVQIHNYAIVGQTIWIFDENTAKKMSLAQLDMDATKRVNEENGVLFLLPGMR